MASSRRLSSMACSWVTPFIVALCLDTAEAFNLNRKKKVEAKAPIEANESLSTDFYAVPAEWLTVALPIAALLLALAYFLVEHGKKSGRQCSALIP